MSGIKYFCAKDVLDFMQKDLLKNCSGFHLIQSSKDIARKNNYRCNMLFSYFSIYLNIQIKSHLKDFDIVTLTSVQKCLGQRYHFYLGWKN